MNIADLFETRVEEKIEPVIKVGERGDEHKLAAEIGSYVVTPMIEAYLDDMLEHYTDTFLQKTTEIGIWISGYFGSGKSHFAKILSLLAGNPVLEGVAGQQAVRVASAARRSSAEFDCQKPVSDFAVRHVGPRVQSQYPGRQQEPPLAKPLALAVLPVSRVQR